jgi:hypothetical protein
MFHDDRLEVCDTFYAEHGDTEYYHVPHRSHGDGHDDLYRIGSTDSNCHDIPICSKHGDL